jgi:hypothetical protein
MELMNEGILVMRKVFLIAFISVITGFFCQSHASGKEKNVQNVFQDTEVGWYAGGIMEVGSIGDEVSFSLGTTGAAVFQGDGYEIHMGIYFLSVDTEHEIMYEETLKEVDINNWGLWLGYTNHPERLVHWKAGCRIGWGKFEPVEENEHHSLVLTPHIDAEFNITENLKASIGPGYRAFLLLDDDMFESPELSKPMGHISVVWHF